MLFISGIFGTLVVVPNPNVCWNYSNNLPICSNLLYKTSFLLTQNKNEPLFQEKCQYGQSSKLYLPMQPRRLVCFIPTQQKSKQTFLYGISGSPGQYTGSKVTSKGW